MPRAPSPDLLDRLAALLGPKGFTRDADELAPWLTDWRGKYHGRAAAMLSPASTAEVQQIVRLCTAAQVALVPQGGNTGMVGGATPDAGGNALLLSLRRMNRVRGIDADARVAVAEAGVILETLHHASEAVSLRFPLTLGGKGSATIGGLVSTNAGGTQVLRHGTMRALVLGLEAVLPDGSVLDALAPLRKDNRGYDPVQLLCGAEGTLGIVTAAALRLVPAVARRGTIWVGVESPERALDLLHALDAHVGARLEGFELMPQRCIAAVERHIAGARAPLTEPSPWHVLIELADTADGEATNDVLDELAAWHGKGRIGAAAVAKNDAEAEGFWRVRDAISEAERKLGPALQHDISVPVAAMPRYIAENPARLAAIWPGIGVLSFGHLGDGNIHHHVQPPPGVDGVAWIAEHGEAVSRAVYAHVAELGGSLSAEHGIGQMKRAILGEQGDAARITLLRGVKSGMDPLGLFNPGKLIP